MITASQFPLCRHSPKITETYWQLRPAPNLEFGALSRGVPIALSCGGKGNALLKLTKSGKILSLPPLSNRVERIPTVEELYSSQELAEHIRELTDQGAYVYILHEQATEPLSEYLRKIGYSPDNPTRIYILVGPEGGITEREIELFTRAGAHKALLGTEILRASTAGAAALCTINVVLGRW